MVGDRLHQWTGPLVPAWVESFAVQARVEALWRQRYVRATGEKSLGVDQVENLLKQSDEQLHWIGPNKMNRALLERADPAKIECDGSERPDSLGIGVIERGPPRRNGDVGGMWKEAKAGAAHPLTTTRGRRRTTFRAMPAASQTSTTSATSLYAIEASSARAPGLGVRTRMPR